MTDDVCLPPAAEAVIADGRRRPVVTARIETDFGAHYLHLEHDGRGRAVGASISSPRKNPDSTVDALIAALSHALDRALGDLAGEARAGGAPSTPNPPSTPDAEARS